MPLSYAFSRAIKLSGSTIWQMGSIEVKTMLCVHSSIPLLCHKRACHLLIDKCVLIL